MLKRYCFISAMEGAPWGGSELLWSGAALRLRQQGHAVAASIWNWPQPVAAIVELEQAGVETDRRRFPTRKDRLMKRLHIGQENKLLDRFRPDLVIISSGHQTGGLQWMQECRRRSLPYITIAQAAGERWWPEDDFARELAEALGHAGACCFVSQHNLELTRKQLVADLPNARVVRNPFNVSYDVAECWSDESQPLRLACVARLDVRDKGQDLLVELFATAKWRERSITLSLFGSGPHADLLDRWIRKTGIGNITLAGHVGDIEQVWATHHALVLPSRVEGLPLALVEAMLCRRTCIVTDVGGNAEFITDNVDGFIAPAPTLPAVDDALERAWKRRQEWREAGRLAGVAVRRQVGRDPIGGLVKLIEEQSAG